MKLAQTTLSRRDSLKIARRFNAGNGSPCASSPAGTAENARPFRPSLRDLNRFASQPGVKTPGYCRSSLWDKTAGENLRESGNAFPLTPALSLGERGNPAPSPGMASDGIRVGGSRKTEASNRCSLSPGERARVRGKSANR